MQQRGDTDTEAHRARLREQFIARSGYTGAEVAALAQDASFRRYYRISNAAGTLLLMDAPPPVEDTRPFVMVDEHLRAIGLVAPRIVARDVEAGFLLLEDFGDGTFTRLLAAGHPARPLYELAVDVLAAINAHPEAARIEVPHYDIDTLLQEASLLPDWHFPLIHGRPIAPVERDDYLNIWRRAFAAMPPPAITLVLRDFHVDNLMLVRRDHRSCCGLLDFQDALIGPAAYDLASLLQDARRDIAADFEASLIEYFFERVPLLERDGFLAWYDLLAAQRHAKVLGIFSRLCLRDGKCTYLEHLPRVIRLLERNLAIPALAPLADWMNRWFPKRLDYHPGNEIRSDS